MADEAVLDSCKEAEVQGTWELDAFQLYLGCRAPPVFPLGFQCIPHCGVYGADYTPCLPLVTLGLPAHRDVWAALPEALQRAMPWSDDEPTELYCVVHTAPAPSPCQKFLCDNTNEVNLMLHCWRFPWAEFRPEADEVAHVDMGLFDTVGVRPVHQDLQDAGVSFEHLSERTVVVHGMAFSPENAQFQLAGDRRVCRFFSAARSVGRRVAALHVLPAVEEAADALRARVAEACTLRELVAALREACGDEAEEVVEPLVRLLDAAGPHCRPAVGGSDRP